MYIRWKGINKRERKNIKSNTGGVGECDEKNPRKLNQGLRESSLSAMHLYELYQPYKIWEKGEGETKNIKNEFSISPSSS